MAQAHEDIIHMVNPVRYDERTDVIDQGGYCVEVEPIDWRNDILADRGAIIASVAVTGWAPYTHLVTVDWSAINGTKRDHFLTTFDALAR